MSTPRLLTIAGSDSGGGAGIQADLKTFAAHGTYGMSVITATTAQNTVEVRAVHGVPPEHVAAQIRAVFDDIGVDAVKVGMLGNAETTRAVAGALKPYAPRHVVLDPVMIAKSGDPLLEDSAIDTLVSELLPLATIVTPNLPEAERLTGIDLRGDPAPQLREHAARRLADLAGHGEGPAVLIKGGHGSQDTVEDLLWWRGEPHYFRHPRLHTRSTHGTGCTLSSAIAARLGLGHGLREAVAQAIDYLHGAIAAAVPMGRGHGPLNHHYRLFPEPILYNPSAGLRTRASAITRASKPTPATMERPIMTAPRFNRFTLQRVLPVLLLSLGAVSGLPAQESDDAIPKDFYVEELDVNLVNVEVYVTDKQGNRINGLTRDDFILTVDKQPVAITNFYAVEDGVPRLEALPTMERPESSEAQAPAPQPAQSPERVEMQRLHLIVYVDNFNLRPFNRNRVIRAARTFLRTKLRPGDEAMLVSYDRSLNIRHPFTRDPDLIASALYELEDMTGHRVHADNERNDLMDLIYNDARDIYDVRGRVQQYAESIYNDLSFTLDALRDQVEDLAGLPGRKAILYVSDGLAMRAGEDAFYALNDKFIDSSVLLDAHRYDATRRMQSLISQANANRVTFYTVDAGGLRTYSYMDASNQNINGGSNIDQVHFSNMQSSLLFLAEETGGFAVINTNNFSPGLNKMAGDFGTYYSLGFSPGSGEQGRYHKIRVKLKEKQKGVRVRHREGFRDKPCGHPHGRGRAGGLALRLSAEPSRHRARGRKSQTRGTASTSWCRS